MSDDTAQSSYLSKSKNKKDKKHASSTIDTVGVAKEALYAKKNMMGSSFGGGGGKSTFGRRSGDR
jgi:hypothetical protein